MSIFPPRLLLSTVLLLPMAVSAVPTHDFTAFGRSGTTLSSINNQGDITGRTWLGPEEYFLFTVKGRDLRIFNELSELNHINNHGDIAGMVGSWYWQPTPAFHKKDGTTVRIPSLDEDSFPSGTATAINDSRVVVGYMSTDNVFTGNVSRAFMYKDGVVKDIGFNSRWTSRATAVNNNGIAVGYGKNEYSDNVAFVYDGTSTQALGTLGGKTSFAYSINDHGTIVGSSATENGSVHAFIYQNGIMTDLGGMGRKMSRAYSLNNVGQFLIEAQDDIASPSDYYLFSNGVIRNIKDLALPDSDWQISSAADINDLGQIIGTACDTDKYCSGMILNPLAPVPEPDTWAMLFGGLGLLGFLRRRRQRKLLLMLATSVLALPAIAHTTPPQYEAKRIGINDGQWGPYHAWVLNDAGNAAGVDGYGLSLTARAWINGQLQDIGRLGGFSAQALGINNHGTIVGQSTIWDGNLRAFQWKDGVMSALPTLRGRAKANAINDQGVIVGESNITRAEEYGTTHAVMWSSQGKITDLGTLGGNNSTAVAVNAAGTIIGNSENAAGINRAFIYKNGVMQDLGALLGPGARTYVTALNDQEQILGFTTSPNGAWDSFIYANGKMQLFSLFEDGDPFLKSINNRGSIVGRYMKKHDDGISRGVGFTYISGIAYDLDALVKASPDIHFKDAVDINNNNQILAYGCNKIARNDCSYYRLDLLSAVPEPSTWFMLFSGISAIGLTARRRRRVA